MSYDVGTSLPLYSCGSSSKSLAIASIASSTMIVSEELLMILLRIVTATGITEAKKINSKIIDFVSVAFCKRISAVGTKVTKILLIDVLYELSALIIDIANFNT